MKPPERFRTRTDVVVAVDPETDQRAKTMLAPDKRKRARAKLQFGQLSAEGVTAHYPSAATLATIRWWTVDGHQVTIHDVVLVTVPSKGQTLDLMAYPLLDEALALHYDESYFVDGEFRGAADFSNLLVMSVTHVAGVAPELIVDVTDPMGSWCMSCGEPISEEELSRRLHDPLLALTRAAQDVVVLLYEGERSGKGLGQLHAALAALPESWKREADDAASEQRAAER